MALLHVGLHGLDLADGADAAARAAHALWTVEPGAAEAARDPREAGGHGPPPPRQVPRRHWRRRRQARRGERGLWGRNAWRRRGGLGACAVYWGCDWTRIWVEDSGSRPGVGLEFLLLRK